MSGNNENIRTNKRLILILVCLSLLLQALVIYFPAESQGETVISRDTHINGEQIWSFLGSPYIIKGNVYVDNNAILTIGAGVTVKFDEDAQMIVNGGLIIAGISNNPVIFTTNSTVRPGPDEWNYLGLNPSDEIVSIDNLTVRYSRYGLRFAAGCNGVDWHFNNILVETVNTGVFMNAVDKIKIDNIEIQNCQWKGISMVGSINVTFNKFNITNTLQAGIILDNVQDCVFRDGDVSNSDTSGITMISTSNNNKVINTKFHRCKAGVTIYSGSRNNIIDGCEIYENLESGLDTPTDNGAVFRDNELHSNPENFALTPHQNYDLTFQNVNTVEGDPVVTLEDTSTYEVEGSRQSVGMLIIKNCSNIGVSGLYLQNNTPSILVHGSSNIRIGNSTFSSSPEGLRTYQSNNIHINNNTFDLHGLPSAGVYVEYSNQINISKNRFFDIPDGNENNNQSIGVAIGESHHIWVDGNAFENVTTAVAAGIDSGDCDRLWVADNNIISPKIGLLLANGRRYHVMNNRIDNAETGVMLLIVTQSEIRDNGILNSENSVVLLGVNWTKIVNNLFQDSQRGLNLSMSLNRGRGGTRWVLPPDFFKSENNSIYYNVFKDITDPLVRGFEEVKNFWNHSEFLEGNYWSNYMGADDGSNGAVPGDGIGDTLLPHEDVDNYPFMEEWGWRPEVPVIEPIPENSFDVESIVVNWSESSQAEGYVLHISEDESFQYFREIGSHNNSTEVSFIGEGHKYMRVIAENQYGFRDFSDMVMTNFQLSPLEPFNQSVSLPPEGNSINFSWESVPDLNVEAFEILFFEGIETQFPPTSPYASGWISTNVSQEQNWILIEGLENGMNYTFTVRALDSFGLISPVTILIYAAPQDITPPEAPGPLTIGTLDAYFVEFNLSPPPSDDIKEYRLYRSTGTRAVSLASTATGNSTVIADDNPVAGNSQYAVAAVDHSNNTSPYSPWINVTVPSKNFAPILSSNSSLFFIHMFEDKKYEDYNLKNLFMDPDNDTLEFGYLARDNLTVIVDPLTGNATLTPAENYFGPLNVTFYANDTEYNISATIDIDVEPVNDWPMILQLLSPAQGESVLWGSRLPLAVNASDVDLPKGSSLYISWVIPGRGIIANGADVILDTSSLYPGDYLLIVNVTDDQMAWVTANVSFSILHIFQALGGSGPIEFNAGKRTDFEIEFSYQGELTDNATASIIVGSPLSDHITVVEVLKDNNSKKIIVKGYADVPDDQEIKQYNVTLSIKVGGNEAFRHSMKVKVSSSSGPDDKKDGSDDESGGGWIWLLIIIVLVLFVVVAIVVILLRKKSRSDDMPGDDMDRADPDYEGQGEDAEDTMAYEDEFDDGIGGEAIPEEPSFIDEERMDGEDIEPPADVPDAYPEPAPESEFESLPPVPEEEQDVPAAAEPIPPAAGAPVLKSGHMTEGKSPKEKVPKIAVAETSFTCRICFGVVKGGLPIIKCRCGKMYHQTCAERVGECPGCEFDYGNWDGLKEDFIPTPSEDDDLGPDTEMSEDQEEEVPAGKQPKAEDDMFKIDL